MQNPSAPQKMLVLSYLDLRKAVGYVALLLPFAVVIPLWLVNGHHIEGSISGYYYTGMRNLFVGSLCAISMFMLGCRGYDRKDEIAGTFSGICALGVAFFPCGAGAEDPCNTMGFFAHTGPIHYAFAASLFLTLAYFCLALFRKTRTKGQETPQKLERNRVYTGCGWVILVSMAAIGTLAILQHYGGLAVKDFINTFHTSLIFETTSLLAFGLAWLTKGETFLKDQVPPASEEASDGFALRHSGHSRY